MADPGPKSDGDDDAPSFPAPRKREDPSPYRKVTRSVSGDPAASVKRPVIVSRPDDPPDSPVVRRATPMPPMPPTPPTLPMRLETIGSPTPLGVRALARYPRLFGAGSFLLGAWLFRNLARENDAFFFGGRRYLRVRGNSSFYLYSGVAVFGLWLVVFGVPIDEKTGRPPDWWVAGLVIAEILTFAGKDWLRTLAMMLS